MKRTSTNQFVPTPKGQKTIKMLEVEQRIGRTLEEDFREYHLQKGWGQKKIANRWGVKRTTIFSTCLPGRRRCWAEMLDLPVRRLNQQEVTHTTVASRAHACEICGEFAGRLERAHWISRKDGGGTQQFNILRLCRNCHGKLDDGNPFAVELAREKLLFREAKRIVETGQDSTAKKKELVKVCTQIITQEIV